MTAYAILGSVAGTFAWGVYAADRWIFRHEDAAARDARKAQS